MTRDVIFDYIDEEYQRQAHDIELIASENWVSKAVLEAQGSILTNKYAEGYPNKRYYNGTEIIDKIEQTAIDRAKELYHAGYANVQPHSGSQANEAAYASMLKTGDRILGMNLTDGGHLTHGSPVSFSGKLYHVESYGVREDDQRIDYDQVRQLAKEFKPQLIIAGASAYPRIIDFKAFREIADEVGAYLLVDMAHIAGLVATGEHPSPLPYADVVTTTTHKTLRGPRGGMILSNNEDLYKKLNSAVFPRTQGGPLEHVIAAKAVALGEAMQEDFKTYAHQIVLNAKAMEEVFREENIPMVSDGTDNHLLLLRVTDFGVTGQDVSTELNDLNIIVNKNTIPFETLGPIKTSGIRLGTPAITTRGFKEEESRMVAKMISDVIKHPHDEAVTKQVKETVKQLTKKFPLS